MQSVNNPWCVHSLHNSITTSFGVITSIIKMSHLSQSSLDSVPWKLSSNGLLFLDNRLLDLQHNSQSKDKHPILPSGQRKVKAKKMGLHSDRCVFSRAVCVLLQTRGQCTRGMKRRISCVRPSQQRESREPG